MSETAARRDLVRYSHAMHAAGWVANHDGNLSARVGPDRIVCTPTSFSKADVTLERLRCDRQDRAVPLHVLLRVGLGLDRQREDGDRDQAANDSDQPDEEEEEEEEEVPIANKRRKKKTPAISSGSEDDDEDFDGGDDDEDGEE